LESIIIDHRYARRHDDLHEIDDDERYNEDDKVVIPMPR